MLQVTWQAGEQPQGGDTGSPADHSPGEHLVSQVRMAAQGYCWRVPERSFRAIPDFKKGKCEVREKGK